MRNKTEGVLKCFGRSMTQMWFKTIAPNQQTIAFTWNAVYNCVSLIAHNITKYSIHEKKDWFESNINMWSTIDSEN